MHDLSLVLLQDVTGSFVSSLVSLGTSAQSMLTRAVLVLAKSLRLETQHQSTTVTHLIQCEHQSTMLTHLIQREHQSTTVTHLIEHEHQSTTLTHLIQREHHPPDRRILQMPVLETKSTSICMTAVNVFSIR
jgi:hypothetical protein